MPGNGLSDWPSYGEIRNSLKTWRFFLVHHGASNKQFSDVPSSAIFSLVGELVKLDGYAENREDFRNKAQSIIQKFNAGIAKVHGYPENMLRISLDRYSSWIEDSKLGIKVFIDENKFKAFIGNLASNRKNLWKTFDYISVCRNIFLENAVKDRNFKSKISNFQESVRSFASINLSSIEDTYSMLGIRVQKTIDDLVKKIRKEEKRGSSLIYFPYTIIYLNELRLKISSFQSLSTIGDFTACLSEMRRVIEGLSSHLFMDQLKMNLLKKNKKFAPDLYLLFNEGSVKEGNELGLKIREINSKAEILRNPLLKQIMSEPDIDTGKVDARRFSWNLHRNMSTASYFLLYGRPASEIPKFKSASEEQKEKSMLQFVDYSDARYREFLDAGIEEILQALSSERLKMGRDEIRSSFLSVLSGTEMVVIPPAPTLPLRLLGYSILRPETREELLDMYNELSPFAHACWESNTMWPFTSVLEIMTYSKWLKRFESVLYNSLDQYLEFLEVNQESLFGQSTQRSSGSSAS